MKKILFLTLAMAALSGRAFAQPGFCTNIVSCFQNFATSTCQAVQQNCPGLGGISGSGTTFFIPRFTGTASIGNSSLSENSGGSVVTLNSSRLFFGGTEPTPEVEAQNAFDMKATNAIRFIDPSDAARATFNWATTTPTLILERPWVGTPGEGPTGLTVRPITEGDFSGGIGRGLFVQLAGNAGSIVGSRLIGLDVNSLTNPSAATEVALRVGATGWDADLLTKDHNLRVQMGALSDPPTGEVKVYVRDDLDQLAGGLSADCAMVVRNAVGVEKLLLVLATDAACP